MKKIVVKIMAILLALNSCVITPIYAEENLDNEPVIIETENNNEIIDIPEEDEEDQEIEIIDNQEEVNFSQEEIIDSQEEETKEVHEKELPKNSLTTTPGPLTLGTVLHTGNCGASGENLTYTHYSDNSLVISGTGEMADYDNNAPWEEWGRGYKPIYSIIIEEGVESIGNNAFESFMNVKEPIVLPTTLTKIGSKAFDGCSLLSKVYIPSTVTTIGYEAFRGCPGTLVLYTNVSDAGSVPAGWDSTWNKKIYWTDVEHIETYIVSYDTSLDTFNSLTSDWDYNSTTKVLTISGNGPMTTYLWDAQPWHSNRGNISQIVIEEGVTIISEAAFMMNSASSVTIPDSVFYIGKNAFNLCNLTSVTIPATVTKIGEEAFGSDKTVSMTVESGNPTYDSRDNCNAIIETSTNTLINGCKNTVIPSTVTTIAQNAFQNLDSMTSFDFPSTVEHIYPNFSGCFGLKKIFISKETDTIDEFAFDSLSNKEQVIIYTDVEDEGDIPVGWDSDWNSYHDDDYVAQKYTIQYNTTHDEYIDIINHQPVPSDLTVKADSNGNIIVHTNDTDYLEALTNFQSNDGSPTTYIGVTFSSIGGEHLFRNFISNSYEITELYYDASKKNVTLKNEDIIKSKIMNGSKQVTINVDGYESVEKTITLSHACNVVNGSTVSISENSNGDIVITCPNTAWIKAIAQNNSCVSICTDEEFYYYDRIDFSKNNATPNGSFAITNGGKTLTITNEHILEKAVINGTYYLRIDAYGYVLYSDLITIGKGATVVDPATLSIACNQGDGTITITSNTDDNDAFMEKLVSYTIINWKLGKNEADGGCIEFVDLNNIESYTRTFRNEQFKYGSEIQGENVDFELSGDKSTLTITNEAIFRHTLGKGGSYNLIIKAPGYTNVTKELSNITVGVDPYPSDINISQNTSGDIIISSQNLTFLQALTETNDNWDNWVTVFKDNYSQGGHLELTNTNSEQHLILDEAAKTVTIKNKDLLLYNYELVGEHAIGVYVKGYTNYVDEQVNLQYTGAKDPTKRINAPASLVLNGLCKLTFADYDSDVEWISNNENVATIDSTGLLKAHSLGTTTIIAKHFVGGTNVYDKVNVNVVSNSKVSLKLATTDKNTVAVVGEDEDLVLTATGYTLTDADEVTYTASPEGIVEFDGNTVSFNAPGTVTIKAEAVGKSATLKLTVYNVDKTKKLTVSYTGETLETGEEVDDKITVLAGGEDLPNGVVLVYTSSKDSIASVDSNGKITANGKGTATITVALKDDPAKRKATCKVTVIDRIIESFSEDLNVEDNTALVLDKCKEPGDNNGVRYVHASFGLLNKNNKLHIDITDMGVAENNQDPVTPAKVTYKSNNTSVATIDAKGYITFKKAGKTTITVTVASNPKGHAVVSRDIEVEAVDYTPRIETNKFVLNKFVDYSINEYPTYNLHKILSTDSDLIQDYKITDLKGEESEYFLVDYYGDTGNIDTFSIIFNDDPLDVPAKTYTQLLQFCVGDNNWYSYKVTIQVTATLPTVTPKVTGFYNTFTGENTLKLETTVKNGVLADYGIEFDDAWADFDFDTKEISNPSASSGKVRFTFDGYNSNVSVEKTIKLTYKSTKPTVKLDNSTVTLYIPNGFEGTEKTAIVKLIDSNKNVITDGTVEQITGLNDSDINDNDFLNDGSIELVIPTAGLKSGKIVLSYTGDGWNGSIPLTVNVKTSTVAPKAAVSSSSFNLNRYFHTSDTVTLSIPGSSELISDDETYFSVINDELTPSISNGVITLNYEWNGTDIYGTCSGTFYVYPKTVSGLELPRITLKFNVSNAVPTVKLKTSSLTFNANYYEEIPVGYTISNNNYNTSLDRFIVKKLSDASGYPVSPDGEDQYVNVVENSLDSEKMKLELVRYSTDYPHQVYAGTGKSKVSVIPVYKDVNDSDVFGSPVTLTINVLGYFAKAPTASVTVKNAINPLDVSSSSPATVKLTNLVDDVTAIEITSDTYKDLFEFDDNLMLKIKDGADGFNDLKDGTYKVNALVKTSLIPGGIDTTLSIKIARKAPTVKLDKTTVNVYDVTLDSGNKLGEVCLDFDGDNYAIDSATITPTNPAYTVTFDSDNNKFIIKMADGTQIKSGSSVAFSVKLVWKNDYTNGGKYTKTTTVKFNVKDASNLIKVS